MTTPQVQEMTPPQQVEELNPLRFEEVITRLNEMSRQQEELSRQQREVSRQLMELSTQRREVITQRREVIMRDMATPQMEEVVMTQMTPQRKEEMLRRTMGELETGAEILQKERHTIREWLMILAFFLYTASLGLALNCKDDFNKKTDEVETLRDDLWISSVVCLVIGTAIWIDIIIASIRYKFPIGGPHMSVYLLGFGALAICFLTWAGYPYAE